MLSFKHLSKRWTKDKVNFIYTYIKNMTTVTDDSIKVPIDDSNLWETYFTIRNIMEPMPEKENAKGFSIFDKKKDKLIPLFISKYEAGVKVLGLGIGAGTKVQRMIEKEKFRTLNNKVFLLDVELYKSLLAGSQKWSKKYREKITTADGRDVMAVYPFDQRKLGKADDDFVIEQMFNWLDQKTIIEIIKKKFNLIEVK